MNKLLYIVLVIALFATCFTACSKTSPAPTSKTNLHQSTPMTVSTPLLTTDNQNQQSLTDDALSIKEFTETTANRQEPIKNVVSDQKAVEQAPEETKPVSKPISKVESKLESKEAKKQTASQSANFKNDSSQTATIDSDKDKETQHEFQADAISQLPIFSSVSQMEAFLKNRKAQNDVEAEILNAFGNQKVYHRPVQVDAWQLQKINLTLSGCTHYFYDFDDVVNTGSFGCDLLISVYESDPLGNNQSHFNFLKNKSGSQSFTIEEREYVYCENNSGSYSISWFQDKMYHTANLNSHTDQIETILPLLKIERVSLNTTDLVTQ